MGQFCLRFIGTFLTFDLVPVEHFCTDTLLDTAWDVKWMRNELLRLVAASFVKHNKRFIYKVPNLLRKMTSASDSSLRYFPKPLAGLSVFLNRSGCEDGWIGAQSHIAAGRRQGTTSTLLFVLMLKYQKQLQSKINSKQSELRGDSAVVGMSRVVQRLPKSNEWNCGRCVIKMEGLYFKDTIQ